MHVDKIARKSTLRIRDRLVKQSSTQRKNATWTHPLWRKPHPRQLRIPWSIFLLEKTATVDISSWNPDDTNACSTLMPCKTTSTERHRVGTLYNENAFIERDPASASRQNLPFRSKHLDQNMNSSNLQKIATKKPTPATKLEEPKLTVNSTKADIQISVRIGMIEVVFWTMSTLKLLIYFKVKLHHIFIPESQLDTVFALNFIMLGAYVPVCMSRMEPNMFLVYPPSPEN